MFQEYVPALTPPITSLPWRSRIPATSDAWRPTRRGRRIWPIERSAADPVLAADVTGLRSGLLLRQNPDDLLFREPARLYVHPSEVTDSIHSWRWAPP
jgi:hypothetical protein